MGEPFISMPSRLILKRDWIVDPGPEWFIGRLDDDQLRRIASRQLDYARRVTRAHMEVLQAELDMIDAFEAEALGGAQK